MYTKFTDYNTYNTTRTPMGNNIVHIVSVNKKTNVKEYDVYRVRYNTRYFKTDLVFDTYEKAYEYTRYCQIELNKQKFNNRKTDKYVADVIEYPENLLKELGISPEEYANFYTEIVPNFNENFVNVLEKGLLKEKEQQIIINRYQHYETLEQVGKSFGVTRERIRQIEYKALRKLKHPSLRNMLIQGREKLELINAEERARLLEEVKAQITKDIAIQVVLEQCNSTEVEAILRQLAANKPEQQILIGSVEDLDLSVRSANCLRRAGIETIGDLTNRTIEEMMKVRNLGKKSLKEIRIALERLGLSFREDD